MHITRLINPWKVGYGTSEVRRLKYFPNTNSKNRILALGLIKYPIFDAKLNSVEVPKCMHEDFKELEFALTLNKTSIAHRESRATRLLSTS